MPLRTPPAAAIAALFVFTAQLSAEPNATAPASRADRDRSAARAALNLVQRNVGGRASEELEREIQRDPATVYDYLRYLGNPRIPSLEQSLLTNAHAAAEYAESVLCARWPEAEPVIASNPFAASVYAARVLCRPWPGAESMIFSNGNAVAWYGSKFPRRITTRARQRMESDPWGAAIFAETQRIRRVDLEPVILKSAGAAVHYAETVIKGRWPEAESLIAADATAATDYTKALIKGRWLPAEPLIARDPAALSRYLSTPGVDWPQGAVTLAAACVATPGENWHSEALCRVAAAWETLRQRPGLRAQVYMQINPSVGKSETPPLPPAEDFACNAETALFFAKKTGKRFPAGEPVILQSPLAALSYAKQVLKMPWPEAEPIIARHGVAAMHYARDVLKRRWPEGEPAILSHPGMASEYAIYVIRARWPEGEPVIAGTAYGAFRYATCILNTRWPLAEPIVAQSAYAANYAIRLMSARWMEGEPAMPLGVHGCAEYAERFRLTDWPKACEILARRDSSYLAPLLENLPRRPRPELGELILETHAAGAVSAYAKHVIGGRWPEAEPVILSGNSPGVALEYAERVIRGRWPEAEALIRTDDHCASEYATKLLKAPWPKAETDTGGGENLARQDTLKTPSQ